MEDVRMLLRVLVMLLPLPVFWALFDQQVSCSVDNILVHVTTDRRAPGTSHPMHMCHAFFRQQCLFFY